LIKHSLQIGFLFFCALLYANEGLARPYYEQILSKQNPADVAALRQSLNSSLQDPNALLARRARVKDADRSILIELAFSAGHPELVFLTELDGQYLVYLWSVGFIRDNSRDHGKLIRQIEKADFEKAFKQLSDRKQSPPSIKISSQRFTWQQGYVGIVNLSSKQIQQQYLLSTDDLYKLIKSTAFQDLLGYSILGGGHYRGGYRTEAGWVNKFIDSLRQLPRNPKAQLQVALFEALESQNWSLVDALIAQGADVNEYLEDGATPIIWATLNNRSLAVQQLLKRGADPLRETFFGETLEDLANRFRVREAVASNPESITTRRDFLSKKALNAQSPSERCNVLLDILSNETTSDLAVLINDDLSPNCSRSSGATPIMLAAGNVDAKTLEFVISKQGNLDATNFNGATALMYAASSGKTANVASLLSKKADTEIRDKQGQTALLMAKQQNAIEIIALLEQAALKSRAH
jgi:uncharacterized protein